MLRPRSLISLISLISLLACSALLACVPTHAATPYPSAEPVEGEAEVPPPQPAGPNAVRFLDRSVDLEPFLAGFPYQHFMPSLEHGQLFFVETGDRYLLRSLPLPTGAAGSAASATLDLSKAEPVSEVDWSKRSLWDARLHGPSNSLWLHADAANDEQMNLWRVDLGKPSAAEREPEQLTFADYVYGFGFSEDDGQIAYLARRGQQAPYTTCLRLLDANDPKRAGADQEVVCDSPKLRFTWSRPQFSPDGKQVYFAAQVEGDRKRVQLVEVDLRGERPKVEIVTDADKPRSSADMLEGWIDGDLLLYTANDEGFGNLYAWSRRTRKHVRLTSLQEELLGAVRTDAGVLLAHGTPAGSTLKMVDPKHAGAVLGEAKVAGKVDLLDGHGDRAVWTQQAPDKVFEANLAHFDRGSDGLALRNDPLITLDPALEAALVRASVEAVTIPSFDGLPLHAFVLRPKQPLSDARGPIVMIRSFYGGDNEWNRYDHILCAAGITVVSPAVRGSSGFGKEFSGRNDGDLGGDEIVDLFSVARWAEAKLGVAPGRVGVYGRSHGGYATMRAMTFPPTTNGRDQSYRFGFGLAEAGFSDIVAFHDATNIPDWVVLEAGDPAIPEQRAKLIDRSPISHVDLLNAPIFLLHGGSDWRVPVEGSRAFVKAAEAAGKQVTYVEVEGQGHHIEGQDRIVAAWQARFDFIAEALASSSE